MSANEPPQVLVCIRICPYLKPPTKLIGGGQFTLHVRDDLIGATYEPGIEQCYFGCNKTEGRCRQQEEVGAEGHGINFVYVKVARTENCEVKS